MLASRHSAPRASGTPLPVPSLAVLAAAIFVSGTCEFLPGGLIPLMSADLQVPPQNLGVLVWAFALAIVATATPLSLLTRTLDRKTLMMAAFILFGVANVLTALAPGMELLIISRVLGGAAHGLFWTVMFGYTALLVSPGQLTRANSITALGGSSAGILGIPIGNALGQVFGWRAAFGLFAGLVFAVALLLHFLLPKVDHRVAVRTGEILLPVHRDRSLPIVLAICGAIVVTVLAQVSFGTFQATWLVDEAGFPHATLPVVLFATGLASILGLSLKAWIGERRTSLVFVVSIAICILTLAVLPATAGAGLSALAVVLLLLYGVAFGGIPVHIQTSMMRTTSPQLRHVASALQATAFNVGIGGGAWVGGLIIETFGLGVLPVGAALIAVVGLAVAVVVEVFRRRFLARQSPLDSQRR